MSCNPAIGGIGKSHLVREIDALGGEMAKAIDETGIQFRVLNTRKGPAVRATRAQADKAAYRRRMKQVVETTANLAVRQGVLNVLSLRTRGDRRRDPNWRNLSYQESDYHHWHVLEGTHSYRVEKLSAGRRRFSAEGLSRESHGIGISYWSPQDRYVSTVGQSHYDYSVLDPQYGTSRLRSRFRR